MLNGRDRHRTQESQTAIGASSSRYSATALTVPTVSPTSPGRSGGIDRPAIDHHDAHCVSAWSRYATTNTVVDDDDQPVDPRPKRWVRQHRLDHEIGRGTEQEKGERLEARRGPLARERRDRDCRHPGRAGQQERRPQVGATTNSDDPGHDDRAEDQDLVEDARLGGRQEVGGAAEERQVDEEERDDDPGERLAGSHVVIVGRSEVEERASSAPVA